MLGEILKLADNLWLIVGAMPEDIPNSIVYQRGNRVYLLDSGAGSVFRASIMKVLSQLSPMQSFTLLNSHAHADHVGNNDLISIVQAKETHHYLSEAGLDLIDYLQYFTDQFSALSDVYNPAYGFQAHRLRWRILGLLSPSLMRLLGERRVLKMIFSLYFRITLRYFQPIRPSIETIQTYESLPSSELSIGQTPWKGWVMGEDDVWVLKAGGHTPDGVLFYLPEHHLLSTGDLTFPFFPTFPISDGKVTREMIRKCESMASSGNLSLLVDGHHTQAYRGKEEITTFLTKLLTDQEHFQSVLEEIVKEHEGLTVGQIYELLQLRRDDPVIKYYLSIEYPYLPMALQQIIAVSLAQMGFEGRGARRKKRFYLSVKHS